MHKNTNTLFGTISGNQACAHKQPKACAHKQPKVGVCLVYKENLLGKFSKE